MFETLISMIREYRQESIGSVFKLIMNQPDFGRTTSTSGEHKYYTFAWNNGPAQKVVLDELKYEFPENSVLPIMMSQRFQFEKPKQVVALQFNREFY